MRKAICRGPHQSRCSFRCEELPLKDEVPSRSLVRRNVRLNAELGVAILIIQVRFDMKIADMECRSCDEIDIAVDAAQPPEVLVFEVATVTPSVDFDCQRVVAWLEITGDIEFGRRHTPLAIADLFAIDPEVERRLDAGEVDEDLPSLPTLGNREIAAIRSNRIAVLVGGPVGGRLLL